MLADATLPESAIGALTTHLKEIEVGRNKLFEEFFPEPSRERNEFKNFLDNYIMHIEQIINEAKENQVEDTRIPFATIGSEVEVQDPANSEVYRYRIVSPLNASVAEGDVSYLSPVGKSLLLKKVGDQIEVNAPGGVYHYRIKSIKNPTKAVSLL